MRSVSSSTSPVHFPRHRGQAPGGRPVRKHSRFKQASLAGTTVAAVVFLVGTAFPTAASAAQTVQLGTAAPFAVLAHSAVTDVPTSTITGDVGLSPAAGTKITGLTPAEVSGTIYAPDTTGPGGIAGDNPLLLTMATHDLTTAYNNAAGDGATTTYTTGDNQLGGKTLTAGVYAFGGASSANITAAGPLVLDGGGSYDSVFVFQASSTLVTASNSVVQTRERCPSLQRLLAGRQLGDPGHREHFRGYDHGQSVGNAQHGRHRPGPGPGPQRRRDPRRQHHHHPVDVQDGARLTHHDDHDHVARHHPDHGARHHPDHRARHHRHHPARRPGHHRHHLARRLGWHRGGNFRYLGHDDRHGEGRPEPVALPAPAPAGPGSSHPGSPTPAWAERPIPVIGSSSCSVRRSWPERWWPSPSDSAGAVFSPTGEDRPVGMRSDLLVTPAA